MILDEKIFSKKDALLLYLERYVNIGSPSGFTYKYTTSLHTSPVSDKKSFHLLGLDFEESVNVYSYGDYSRLLSNYDLIIHPDMIGEPSLRPYVSKLMPFLDVAPTSSGRTVKVLNEYDSFLKLHYNGLLGRIPRVLEKDHAISSIEVSEVISSAIDNGNVPESFYFFRETSAKVAEIPYEGGICQWGVIERAAKPYPDDDQIKFIIPAFSLFSKDIKEVDDKAILLQLFERQTKELNDFLFEDIISPIIESYFSIVLKCGLQMDAQAQNTLIGIDVNYKVVGVIFRDAESIDKDVTLVNTMGIDVKFTEMKYKSIHEGLYNYQILHSYFFDFKLGEYLITPIIDEAEKYGGLNRVNLVEMIRCLSQEYIKLLPEDYFPEGWYNYANELLDRSKPRPYVRHDDPRYR